MTPATTLGSLRPSAPPLWRYTLSGLAATLVGLGLARFGYSPLLPAIIAAHWFQAADAAYLGAANLAGYLLGALLIGRVARRIAAPTLLRWSMLVTSAALLASAWPLDFAWFFALRFISGMTGAVLMVLAVPTVLPHVPAARRGIAGGAMFTGVGLGIAASGTLVPLLLSHGLTETWLGLGALSLVMTLVAWNGWPTAEPQAVAATHAATMQPKPTARLRSLYAEYGFNALGLVPAMIFLVDYVARGLGQGLADGAHYWVLFGLGAIVGPLLTGHLADRTGFGPAIRLAYLVQAVAVALLIVGPLVGLGTPALIVASLVLGAFTPGIVTLTLGRVNELLAHHPALRKGAWSHATTAFAVFQAAGAYAMSYLLVRSGGDYRLLFVAATASIVLALALNLVTAVAARPH